MSASKLIGYSGRPISQRRDELDSFKRLLRTHDVRAYLEIGAREGDTFHEVMLALEPGSRGIAVDLPGAKWGKSNSKHLLGRALKDLNARGYEVRAIVGDSHDEKIIAEVRKHAPFDAVFIDADHSYSAVLRDWLAYGGLAPLVAFHDIDGFGMHTKDGSPVEVPELWGELESRFESKRFVCAERGMGIGVLFVNEPKAKG